MSLPKKDVEWDELNLVEDNQNETTTTILTTNLPTEEQQIEYFTLLQANKNKSNQKYDMMQLKGTVICDNTEKKACQETFCEEVEDKGEKI